MKEGDAVQSSIGAQWGGGWEGCFIKENQGKSSKNMTLN